jgi:hypothetical protein
MRVLHGNQLSRLWTTPGSGRTTSQTGAEERDDLSYLEMKPWAIFSSGICSLDSSHLFRLGRGTLEALGGLMFVGLRERCAEILAGSNDERVDSTHKEWRRDHVNRVVGLLEQHANGREQRRHSECQFPDTVVATDTDEQAEHRGRMAAEKEITHEHGAIGVGDRIHKGHNARGCLEWCEVEREHAYPDDDHVGLNELEEKIRFLVRILDGREQTTVHEDGEHLRAVESRQMHEDRIAERYERGHVGTGLIRTEKGRVVSQREATCTSNE